MIAHTLRRVSTVDPEVQRIADEWRETARLYDVKAEALRAEGRDWLAGEYEQAAKDWRREAGRLERGERPAT